MTIKCIRSVYEQADSNDFELIVVDNSSVDGSADAIAAEFPTVKLVRSTENMGFGRANNLAATMASGDLILLLNPDTLILDHAIDRLIGFSREHPQAGIWGGRTVFGDGSLNPTSCWRFISLWSVFAQQTGLTSLWRDSDIFNPEGYGGWLRDSPREVDIVTGCFLLITRDLWNSLKGFDETFFMYSEESDLCFRAGLRGARPMFTPEATIVHYGGAIRASSASKIVARYAGKATFMRKHWPFAKRVLGIELMQLGVGFRVFAYRTMAVFGKSDALAATATEWKDVWSRRAEWAGGY